MLYQPGNTFFHRTDPRAKFLMIIVVLILALSTTRIDALAVLTVVVMAALALFAGITPARYWKVLALIVPLIIVLTLIQALMQSGDPLFTIGSVDFSRKGVLLGLGIGLRLTAMGICFYGFSVTTSPNEISMALVRMGVPYKLAYLTSFAFRFLPLMQEESSTLMTAMAVRGSSESSSTNPVARSRAIIRMVFPMLVGAMKRSGDIALSMELRGYERKGRRTSYQALRITGGDVIFIIGVVIVTVVMVGLQMYVPNPLPAAA